MIETNIRIVHPGTKLFVRTRQATVHGTNLDPKLLEKACNALLYRGVAAIPDPNNRNTLIVATNRKIEPISLKETDWALDVVDSDKPIVQYHFANTQNREIVTGLVERRLYAELATKTNMWTIDSQSIWYEAKSFTESDDIEAFRRYEIGAIAIDEIGVGIIVDIGTAFFSKLHLGYYFDPEKPDHIQKKREKRFEQLTERDKNKQGTLLYNIGSKNIKCYFGEAPKDVTCSTTGSIRIKNESFQSLTEYYEKKYPNYTCNPQERAIQVSFPNMEQSVWVASSLIRPRVMNDVLPSSIRNVDKLSPKERREKITQFWGKLRFPFGLGMPGMKSGFWQPTEDLIKQLNIPALCYGSGHIQPPPNQKTILDVRNHFHERLDILSEVGAYYVPLTISRKVHFAFPNHIGANVAQHFAEGTIEELRTWTKTPLQIAPIIMYSDVNDAVEQLSADDAEVVIFVMNDEPLAYYNAAHKKVWRIKRIKMHTFERFQRSLSINPNSKSGKYAFNRKWQRFIQTNALDVLQLMDVMPFTVQSFGKYQAQLVIDVGHDRRSFVLSLLIYNEKSIAKFHAITEVYEKGDHQHETINPYTLREAIIGLFKNVLGRRYKAIDALLVLRDGEFREIKNGKFHIQEVKGVNEAIHILKTEGIIASDADVHLADFRKEVRKTIRIWEVSEEGLVTNPLEGTAIIINPKMAVLATTGSASLHQGTAQPVTITGNGQCPDIGAVAQSVFIATQLNWSSPSVAQRFTLGIKDADEELKARDAQQIRQPK